MKPSYAALGAFCLGLGALWFVGGGSEPVQAAEQFVKAPISHENLSIFFIRGEDDIANLKVATLQEALEAGWAVINETGEVNTLTAENRSPDQELFIQEGDVIRGGRQDRMIAQDLLLPPRSGTVSFRCHCVEAGRWTGRGNEAATHFNKSDQFVVSSGLRYANATDKQDSVWQNVSLKQTELGNATGGSVASRESASSLQLSLENPAVQARVAAYQNALKACPEGDRKIVGVVLVVNGRVTGAEVYGSNALFQKVWPKLLRAAAVEAVAGKKEQEAPAIPSVREVEKFLVLAGRNEPINSQILLTSSANVDLDAAGGGVPELVPVRRRNAQLEFRNIATIHPQFDPLGQPAQADIDPALLPRPGLNQEENRGQHTMGLPDANPGVGRVSLPSGERAQNSSDQNSLNINRVENSQGLKTESRDPNRENALIHRSYIRSEGMPAAANAVPAAVRR